MSESTMTRSELRTRDAATTPRGTAIAAIAIGAALLLGGGTTLAFWSDSLNITATPISTGDLKLNAGTAAWTLNGNDVTTSIDTLKIVPGDVLVRTETVEITLVGDSIAATLGLDQSSASLPAGVSATFAATMGGAAAPAQLTAADTGASLTTTVTITFDDATENRDTVNTAVNLSQLKLILQQVAS